MNCHQYPTICEISAFENRRKRKSSKGIVIATKWSIDEILTSMQCTRMLENWKTISRLHSDQTLNWKYFLFVSKFSSGLYDQAWPAIESVSYSSKAYNTKYLRNLSFIDHTMLFLLILAVYTAQVSFHNHYTVTLLVCMHQCIVNYTN